MNFNNNNPKRPYPITLFAPFFLVSCLVLTGCGVPDQVDTDQPALRAFQESMVEKAPQQRLQQDGLKSLAPTENPKIPSLQIQTNPDNGLNEISLSLEQAVLRALAGSPEISVVSFDPSIAREEITQEIGAFDPALFGQVNYEDEDNPTDSFFLGGQSNTRLWEMGIKQKGTTGAEWSLGYALSRNWDDLTTRTLSSRYEPILTFQIRQPLLRDAWGTVNLAGIDISKLNYQIALASFRQQTEAVSTEVISLYWSLHQARTERQIQQKLLDITGRTLQKVQDRSDIDASMAQIKQAETSLKRRQVMLEDIQKQVIDIQDQLTRLLSDSQINLLNDFEIVPVTGPVIEQAFYDETELLQTAMMRNPVVVQSNLAVEIAKINVDVANQQKMPKLDLVASSRMSGLDNSPEDSQHMLYDGDYISYAVGLSLEIPLGNRQREAEFRKRLLERNRAVSTKWNISDQVAVAVKEAIRSAETSYDQMLIQQEAVEAARMYLQALEDMEVIRAQLTPEFLLVKLQAQEALADAERGLIKAITDYNIAMARLAQATGTILDMRYVKNVLPQTAKAN